MPTNTTPIFPAVIITPSVQILPADVSNYKTVVIAGANGSRLDNLICTSDDTSARVLQFAINDGATDYVLGQVNIPLTSGIDGAGTVKGVSIINSINFPGIKDDGAIYLKASYTLKVKSLTTVTSAKQINIIGFGGDY